MPNCVQCHRGFTETENRTINGEKVLIHISMCHVCQGLDRVNRTCIREAVSKGLTPRLAKAEVAYRDGELGLWRSAVKRAMGGHGNFRLIIQ